MKAVHARRLLKLAEFLKTVPPERFDYTKWVGDDWGLAPDLSCGTTACALGWATTMPFFRRMGLQLVRIRPRYTEADGYQRDSIETVCVRPKPARGYPGIKAILPVDDPQGEHWRVIGYAREVAEGSIAEIFGKDPGTQSLFFPNSRVEDQFTPTQVAERIISHVNRNMEKSR